MNVSIEVPLDNTYNLFLISSNNFLMIWLQSMKCRRKVARLKKKLPKGTLSPNN
jgi:hypothetical protein